MTGKHMLAPGDCLRVATTMQKSACPWHPRETASREMVVYEVSGRRGVKGAKAHDRGTVAKLNQIAVRDDCAVYCMNAIV